MDALLVHGFIRQIEKLLQNDKIIPLDIYHICFDFYFATAIVFYLSGLAALGGEVDTDKDLMCAVNMENKKRWKINMHELDDHKSSITMTKCTKEDYCKWSMDGASVSFTRNLELPQFVINQLPDKDMAFNNIVFRCGGGNGHGVTTDYCGALIFKSQEFQKPSNDTITAYNWELPKFAAKTSYFYSLYSPLTQCLYSIQSKHVRLLHFNNDAYSNENQKDWSWTKLESTIPNESSGPSAVMLKNKKLFIIGSKEKVDIFDIDEEQWQTGGKRIKRSYTSEVCGIYYDEPDDIIYAGGGYDNDADVALSSMEKYDIGKDKWMEIPNTNREHDMYPLIWLEDNNNLLHIMSISANCIECIDLREGQKWKIKNENVSEMFNTKFNYDFENATASHIVGN